MKKVIEWIASFFSGKEDSPSSTRLILITGFLSVILVWVVVSIYKLEMQDIPTGILGFLGIVASLKGFQNKIESKKGTEEFKQETIMTTDTDRKGQSQSIQTQTTEVNR